MKRRVVLPCLWALLVPPCSTSAAADAFAQVTGETELRALLSRPAARLRNAQVIRGKFQHSRHLREIPRPLVALGEFIVVRDLGVYWHTQQPFDSVVVLTGAGLAQSDESGPMQRITADEQPAVRLISNIFMALFTLDIQTLARDFDLAGGVAGEKKGRWIIRLTPRAKAIARLFKESSVAGLDDVEQVVLTDTQGDRIVIDLANITYSSDPPGADVRALFVPARP
jgi:hypothetical protein